MRQNNTRGMMKKFSFFLTILFVITTNITFANEHAVTLKMDVLRPNYLKKRSKIYTCRVSWKTDLEYGSGTVQLKGASAKTSHPNMARIEYKPTKLKDKHYLRVECFESRSGKKIKASDPRLIKKRKKSLVETIVNYYGYKVNRLLHKDIELSTLQIISDYTSILNEASVPAYNPDLAYEIRGEEFRDINPYHYGNGNILLTIDQPSGKMTAKFNQY